MGTGWDWDVLLVELLMQASNGAIVACLHFRRQLLRHDRAKQGVAALILANTGLRIAVYAILLEIVFADSSSNDGECKRLVVVGSCSASCSVDVTTC